MKTINVVSACVIFMLPLVRVEAQIPIPIPDFSCKPRSIIGWINGAIPACTDTITLPTDPPPQRDTSGVYTRAASLHRLRWSNDVLVLGEEISCRVIAEPPAEHVHLIPGYHLPTHESDGSPIQYQVNLYCGYWFGNGNSDTTSVRFTMYTRYRAVAEARLMQDSSLLDGEVLVSPVSIPPSGYAITTPIIITAIDEHKNLVFDHWTASHRGIAFDTYGREQMVSVACWPMSDTVRFTAWYRNNSISSVSDAEIPTTASVELYDMQGRRANFEFRNNSQCSGMYIAVVTTSDGVRRCRRYPLFITN